MSLLQRAKKLEQKGAEVITRKKMHTERIAHLTLMLSKGEEALLEKMKAEAILQDVATETQNKIREKVETLVQMAIDAVFGDGEEFRIDFVQRRNKTEADLCLIGPGGERIPPMAGSGGGLLDVMAFALRLACHALQKPAPRRVLILDEPFRFLDKVRKDKAAEMLKVLSEKTKMQIIMVTHEDSLIDAADKLYTVRKPKRISRIKEN